jgi:hypothetical protein
VGREAEGSEEVDGEGPGGDEDFDRHSELVANQFNRMLD